MSKRAKTRFVVPSGGKLRELVAVEERKNGDLIVIPRRASATQLLCELDLPVAYERYSLHLSKQAKTPGRTIIRTMQFEDGRKVRNAQFRMMAGSSYITPVYLRACPNLDFDRYLLSAREKDKVIQVRQGDVSQHSLFYALFASNHKARLPSLRRFGLNVSTADFSEYSLHLAHGFFPVPAIERGYSLFSWTSHQQVDGEETPFWGVHPIQPFPERDIGAFLSIHLLLLGQHLVKQHQIHVFPDGGILDPRLIPEMKEMCKYFSSMTRDEADKLTPRQREKRYMRPIFPGLEGVSIQVP